MILFLGFYIFSGSEGSVAEWLERWKFNSRSDRLLDLFSIIPSSNPRPRELANGLPPPVGILNPARYVCFRHLFGPTTITSAIITAEDK